MRFSMLLSRSAVLILLLVVSVPAVSGWTLNNWGVSPTGSELPPGTEVSASYSLHFDSWMTGTTFENDNSLVMYTDLINPHWTVTKVEPMEGQESITEDLPVRQAAQVRLDGWSLSYSSKKFDVNVKLTGKTPLVNQSTTISLLKFQEMEPNAQPIKSSVIKKEVLVVVPTIAPTQAPPEVTLNMTPSEIIEITPEPKTPTTPAVTGKRVTYSPGPDPLLVFLLLAGLILLGRSAGRRE